eukprot:scaffold156478_cov28-Tisochrysis_lutea.AAC.5
MGGQGLRLMVPIRRPIHTPHQTSELFLWSRSKGLSSGSFHKAAASIAIARRLMPHAAHRLMPRAARAGG